MPVIKGLIKEISEKRKQARADLNEVISSELEKLRKNEYSYFLDLVEGEPIVYDVLSKKGIEVNVEILVFWDSKEKGSIRVLCNASRSGKWDSFRPFSGDFIIAEDGSFVGE